MAYQSAKVLWRRAAFPAFAALAGAGMGLMNRPKARLDGPSSGEADVRERQREDVKAQRVKSLEAAREFCDFADSSPSVYHAVHTVKQYLLERDFIEIEEKNSWAETVEPGGKYFVTRSGGSGSSIIAFAVGKLWEPGNPFAIVATHVDSPCLKLKPISGKNGSGSNCLESRPTAGASGILGLIGTWESQEGVYIRTSETTIQSQLVRLDEALIRVPSLAVHYEKQNPFKFSTEHQLIPVTSQREEMIPLPPPLPDTHDLEPEIVFGPWEYSTTPARRKHPDVLIQKLASQLNIHPDNIIDVDLSLYDVQKATLGGLHNEFIYSARIDNLMMSFCALKSFTKSVDSAIALDDEKSVRTLVMFDHEEIGSAGPIGAQSTFLPTTLQRISALKPQSLSNKDKNEVAKIISNTPYEQAIARSFLISADVHHGKHPNYSGFHETNHVPQLNSGIIFASSSRKYLSKSTPEQS